MMLEIGAMVGSTPGRQLSLHRRELLLHDLAVAEDLRLPAELDVHDGEPEPAASSGRASTPVAPFTACSTRRVTSRSTSSGTSPWASVITVTVGRLRSGSTSTGSDSAVADPVDGDREGERGDRRGARAGCRR